MYKKTMSRYLRQYALLICLACAFPAHAVVLKVATISPDGTGWMQKMRAGAEEIRKQTGDRVIFKFYPGGVMGSDDIVLRKIRIGQLQGGAVTVGSLTDISPGVDIYGMPFLFKSYDEVDHVRSSLDVALIRNLEDKGFVSFGLAEGGFSYMMSDTPLHTIDDIRQQKVWIPSGNFVGEVVFNSAGISPVSLPLSDVLTAMQTGLIDTVINSPIGAIALQWHTRVKYVVDLPLVYYSAMMVIDKKAFDKINPEDAVIVRRIMGDVFKEINAQNRKDNIAAREALKAQGIEFIQLTDAALKDWHNIAEKAMLQIETRDDYSKEVYATLKQRLAQFVAKP